MLQCLLEPGRAEFVQPLACAEIFVVRCDIRDRVLRERGRFLRSDRQLQRLDDGQADAVLHLEHIIERAVELL